MIKFYRKGASFMPMRSALAALKFRKVKHGISLYSLASWRLCGEKVLKNLYLNTMNPQVKKVWSLALSHWQLSLPLIFFFVKAEVMLPRKFQI